MMIEIQKEITITHKINRDMLIFAISEMKAKTSYLFTEEKINIG